MISMLICGCSDREAEKISKISLDAVAIVCDQKLNLYRDDLEMETPPNLAIVNICGKQGMEVVKNVRNAYKKTEIMLISDSTVSPMEYLNPFIHPLSLAIKPYTDKEVFEIIKEFISKIIDENEDGMWINTFNGNKKVLFSNIMYLESREKMINVRLESVEYMIYGTLEQMLSKLPTNFRKCHRSFIVNSRHIKQIKFSENMITLDNDEIIPLSRTCKQNFRGTDEHEKH